MPKKRNPGAGGTATGGDGAQSGRTTHRKDSHNGRRPKAQNAKAISHAVGSETPFTEDAVASAFARRHAGRFKYVPQLGGWLVFAGGCWSPDKLGYVYDRMRKFGRRMAAGRASDRASAQKLAGKHSFVQGALSLAQTDPAMARALAAFDRDPWLLGTPKGVVDLRTGLLRPARPDDLITMTTQVAPADRADCPAWMSFLSDALGDDVEQIRFLRQWCGYNLTGITREHVLVYLHGSGGNGKSVFISVLTEIARAYAKVASMDTFAASNFERHPADLAMLRGARVVTVSETESGRGWSEARIKQVTGGDQITARFMRQDYFTYTPNFKLTFAGNHEPTLKTVDDAARRRFIIVPFVRVPKKPDKELLQKLRAEYPAILRWMIDGCLDWQAEGLFRPATIGRATDDYFERQDLTGQWLADECAVTIGDRTKWTLHRDLYASWSAYAKAAGEEPGSGKSLTSELRRRGLEPDKGARGVRIIRLVTLRKRHTNGGEVRP